MMEITIKTLDNYREQIFNKCANENGHKWIFRGQPVDEPLKAKFWRNYPGIEDIPDIGEKHKKLLDSFRNSINASEYKIRYDKPILQLGQHYGMDTTLLDWTIDPAIALFFPLLSDQEIWIYGLKTCETWVDNKDTCLSIYDPCNFLQWNKIDYFVYMPELLKINHNIRAQKGLFTYIKPCKSEKPEEPIKIEIAQVVGENDNGLIKFKINDDNKNIILKSILNEYPELRYTPFFLQTKSHELNNKLKAIAGQKIT
ncbi:FRG domain-containing protein [Thermoproteota archaeon]